MIDEQRTLEIFGYVSEDLSEYSPKKIVCICEECGKYRVVGKESFTKRKNDDNLCRSCSNREKKMPSWSDEAKRKQSIATMGKNNGFFGKHHKPENIPARDGENNGMYGRKHNEESKQLMSAKLQNVSIEDWEGYSKKNRYCNMWTESVREKIRDEFDRLCFACDKDEKTNGRKLSVHHIDNDRNQGCDETDWKLVPLCNSCHAKILHCPNTWERLIRNAYNYINHGINEDQKLA